MKKQRWWFKSWIVAGLLLLLGGCSTLDIGSPPALDANATWAVLPFANFTETPQAGLRAERIAESLLHSRLQGKVKRYPAKLNSETLFEPAERQASEAALEWARTEKVRYALTGSVEEWRYKVGIDGEPAVGISLQVVDVISGEVLWSATGAASGMSRQALSATAQKLIRRLLAPITH